ncbi:IRS1 family protein [Megaselia abdita]
MTSNSNGGMITMMSSTMMPTTLSTTHHQNGDVVLQGYHKKLKTMRRKYFVLLAEDDKSPARLEYYDSEKKFKSSKSTTKPKRVIHLKNCFNINRRLDTKHDYVIALSTREEVFCMVLDDEAEMNKWLKLLLILQRGENIENTRSDTPQPNYEHVWQVQIQRRGLAERNGIVGPYYVCLTSKSLTLIRIRNTNNTNTTNLVGTEVNHTVEFPLSTIRRYGDSACLFYLEVGRKSVLGTGELWMETEDAFIAKNMHKMISSATTNSKTREEQLAPMRIRSSSASEASKPMLLHRRPTISGNKTINSSPLSAMSTTISHQRAYSLPIEETYNINNDINHKTTGNGLSCKGQCNILNSNSCTQPPPPLPQSTTTVNTCCTICCCNNNNSNNINAATPRSICKNFSTTATVAKQLQPVHQRTRSLPLTEETAISCINSNSPTVNNNTINNNNININGHYLHHNQQQPQPQHHPTMMLMHNGSSNNHHVSGAKLKSQSSSVIHFNNNNNYNNNNKINCTCMFSGNLTTPKGSLLNNNYHLGGVFITAITTRDRCDSLPSTRNRTPSECSNHSITNSSMPPPRTIPSLNQQSAHRPHSMYNRHSHSPPMNTLSPSTGCSESEGSNLSIDEPDSICQSSTPDESGNFAARYYNSRTTGSSNVIPEENDDYASCCAETNHYHRDKLNNQGNIQSSLNLPIHTTTTPYDDIDNQDHYMALSPCASSPHSESCSHAASSLGNDFHPKYMPMSTGNHSRSSSLAEDGYMQMVSDTGKSSKKNGLLTSNTSTCSVNSRDHRYNEFHAENIDTRFDELHLDMERPTRTYSVGSRPEYNKRRLPVENIICNQQMDQNRVRAFSVGSRAKYPRCDQDLIREVMRPNILSSYNNNNITMEGKGRKSTSAPLLVHKSQSSVERMSDLMEIDFSQNSSDRSGSGSVTDSIASPITSTATTVPSIHNQSVPVTTANLSSSPGNVRSLHNRTVSNPVAVPFTRPRCGTFGSSSSPRKATGYDDVDGINVPGDGYCEMKPGSFNKTTEVGSSGSSSGILSKLSNSPLKISSILTKQPMGNEKINTSDYLTMSPSNSNSLSSSTSSLLRSTSRNDRSSSTNRLATSADNKQVAMETDSFPSTASGTPEGYMEMSFNKNKVVINGGNGTWSSQNRSPSMPIDINPKPKSLTQLNTQTSPCIDRSSFLMEEEESHDQVDSGIVTSLPRQFSNPKQFTFNPASASFSPKDDYNHHKCLVDATSGKIQLLNNTSEKNTPNESKILNTEGNQKLEALSNDYAEMTIGDSSSKFNDYADMSSLIAAKSKNQNQKKPVIENDYVNINPREERLVTSLTAITPPTTNGIVKPAPKTPQPVTTTPKANPLFTRQKSEPRRLPEQSSNQHQDSEYEMMCPSPMFKPIKAEDDGDYDGYVPIEFGNNRKLQVNRTNSSNRPKSVEEFSSSSSAISAASSTSTLCGSNSNSSSSASILTAAAATKSLSPTVNGAFKVQQTQPELHYAKLDLPPCSAYNSSSNLASPAAAVCITPPVGGGPGSCSNSASASPSPISNVTQAPTFMYAKIDFNKCEELQRK